MYNNITANKMFNPYKEEFLHPLWLLKKENILQRDGHKCIICGFPINDKRRNRYFDSNERVLEIHFRQYIFDMSQNKYLSPWKYDDKLLTTIDTWCLEKGNKIFNIPIKIIN